MAPESVEATLQRRLDAVPALLGRTGVRVLPGGLTNHNLLVEVPDGALVARLSSPDSALLSIDRAAEHANSVTAARAGAAPEVVGYAPEAGVLVVRYIEGRTWSEADVRAPHHTAAMVAAVQRLHQGPAFNNRFDMLHIQAQYLKLCQQKSFAIPHDYLDYAGHVAAIDRALSVRRVPLVPCHNDLLAANFIDDGSRIWLIDFEYSGQNDPFFELGNIWSEAGGDPDDLERLVSAYLGRYAPAYVARARLWGVMAKYGWMLWAAIQSATSTLDFDFWSWGLEKYDRAVAEFDSPDFSRWLQEVRRPG